jgi:hypothetical protein
MAGSNSRTRAKVARALGWFQLRTPKAPLCLAVVAVQAQDELAALGLDGSSAGHKLPEILIKGNIQYDLAQSQ